MNPSKKSEAEKELKFLDQIRAGSLLGLFLMVLASTIFPQWHEALHHHDSGDDSSCCAACLLLSGGADTSSSDILPPELAPIQQVAQQVLESPSQFSFFVSCFVPDHSPPVRS